MIAPTNEPIAIAQQRALVGAFRNSTQQWADTQQQEGQRYKDSSQEYARQLEQSNQATQSRRSSMEQNRKQVVKALNLVELAQILRDQPDTSFRPTIEDSTKQPVAELNVSVDTLAKLTGDIRRNAEMLSEERALRHIQEERALRHIQEKKEVERLRIIRHRNIAIVAIPLMVLALIYAGNRVYQNNQQRIATAATRVVVEAKQTRSAIEEEQAIANLKAVQETAREIDGITYVYIPAGEFIMGSENGDSDESPQHTVYLDEYWIMQTEVTNAQYRKFIDADGYTTESYWSQDGWKWRTENEIVEPDCWDDSGFNSPQQPIVCVSWYEAEAYANWLSAESGLDFGLPTEAQWEKAARGTEGRIYPWGNQWDGNKANGLGSDDGYGATASVGSYPTSASPYGTLDMAGNVWEWTADWYADDYYQSSSSRNPIGPANGTRRVLHGGSWLHDPDHMRAAYRFRNNPDDRGNVVGFRLRLSSSRD